MPDIRRKLFISYSWGDRKWYDMFITHLKEMVSFEHDLWVDRSSIPAGSDPTSSIERGLAESKCALLLLTPAYLDCDSYARRHELPLLLAEHGRGLVLIPVLVERCSFERDSELKMLEPIRWHNDIRSDGGHPSRIMLRAIAEAGIELQTSAEREAAVNQAVLDVCEHVKKYFGVIARVTEEQVHALPEQIAAALDNKFSAEGEVHSGEFTFVYRGEYRGQTVAAKVCPTAAWRNQVDHALADAVRTSEKLRDASFIRVKELIIDPDVHGVVMEYIEWPTLDKVLAESPDRRLPARTVAALLAKISRAQHEAHKSGAQLGALSTGSIYVNDDWDIRLNPIRIEAHLARGLALSTGQIVNWDILAMLTPEVYEGRQPASRADLDALGQYYLGLLGLELLLGRRPLEITCFRDLAAKSRFFDDPRAFFGDTADGSDRWTSESPALAYILARMLARVPAERLSSADEASDELRSVAEGRLPDALRRCLENDLGQVVGGGFAQRFYERLFMSRPSLKDLFSDRDAQSKMLAAAVRDLAEFRREDGASRFLDYAHTHRRLRLAAEDVEAFRESFVAEVIATCEKNDQSVSARAHGDAWNSALKLGLDVMLGEMNAVSTGPWPARPATARR